MTRAAIDAEIRAARYPGHSPERWALPLLDQIDRQSSGWSLVALEEAEFGELWVPAHQGEPCHGDRMMLGTATDGMRLRDAATWLKLNQEAYAAANTSCWGRIALAARQPRSPIVVAPYSVGDRIKPPDAPLVIVDGLHRALGFWSSGRRTCEAYLPAVAG